MRILIIEDEVEIQTQIRQRLEAEGYMADVSGNGREGLYFATEYPIDAAIVDLGLPGLSGHEVIKRLRSQGNTLPILILTAQGRWQERVEGLEAGADDYLTKPFQMEELLARLKALLRRAKGVTQTVLQCGPIAINFATQQVLVEGKEIELTAFEYRLLEYLAQRRGKVVSKSDLCDYLYPHDGDPDSNVIEVIVGRLRRKLDPGGTLQPIETLRGRGYRIGMNP
jgi:two-component system response regulator PhoP